MWLKRCEFIQPTQQSNCYLASIHLLSRSTCVYPLSIQTFLINTSILVSIYWPLIIPHRFICAIKMFSFFLVSPELALVSHYTWTKQEIWRLEAFFGIWLWFYLRYRGMRSRNIIYEGEINLALRYYTVENPKKLVMIPLHFSPNFWSVSNLTPF